MASKVPSGVTKRKLDEPTSAMTKEMVKAVKAVTKEFGSAVGRMTLSYENASRSVTALERVLTKNVSADGNNLVKALKDTFLPIMAKSLEEAKNAPTEEMRSDAIREFNNELRAFNNTQSKLVQTGIYASKAGMEGVSEENKEFFLQKAGESQKESMEAVASALKTFNASPFLDADSKKALENVEKISGTLDKIEKNTRKEINPVFKNLGQMGLSVGLSMLGPLGMFGSLLYKGLGVDKLIDASMAKRKEQSTFGQSVINADNASSIQELISVQQAYEASQDKLHEDQLKKVLSPKSSSKKKATKKTSTTKSNKEVEDADFEELLPPGVIGTSGIVSTGKITGKKKSTVQKEESSSGVLSAIVPSTSGGRLNRTTLKYYHFFMDIFPISEHMFMEKGGMVGAGFVYIGRKLDALNDKQETKSEKSNKNIFTGLKALLGGLAVATALAIATNIQGAFDTVKEFITETIPAKVGELTQAILDIPKNIAVGIADGLAGLPRAIADALAGKDKETVENPEPEVAKSTGPIGQIIDWFKEMIMAQSGNRITVGGMTPIERNPNSVPVEGRTVDIGQGTVFDSSWQKKAIRNVAIGGTIAAILGIGTKLALAGGLGATAPVFLPIIAALAGASLLLGSSHGLFASGNNENPKVESNSQFSLDENTMKLLGIQPGDMDDVKKYYEMRKNGNPNAKMTGIDTIQNNRVNNAVDTLYEWYQKGIPFGEKSVPKSNPFSTVKPWNAPATPEGQRFVDLDMLQNPALLPQIITSSAIGAGSNNVSVENVDDIGNAVANGITNVLSGMSSTTNVGLDSPIVPVDTRNDISWYSGMVLNLSPMVAN